jgi:hypothetical protein
MVFFFCFLNNQAEIFRIKDQKEAQEQGKQKAQDDMKHKRKTKHPVFAEQRKKESAQEKVEETPGKPS